MSVHNIDLGVASFQLSSLHDFSHTLQPSDTLSLSFSGQKDGVLSESEPPMLPCSPTQLERPSQRSSKRKNPL